MAFVDVEADLTTNGKGGRATPTVVKPRDDDDDEDDDDDGDDDDGDRTAMEEGAEIDEMEDEAEEGRRWSGLQAVLEQAAAAVASEAAEVVEVAAAAAVAEVVAVVVEDAVKCRRTDLGLEQMEC